MMITLTKTKIMMTLFCAASLFSTGVSALTITFDDINLGSGSNLEAPIPNGYQGLNWTNFHVVDTSSLTFPSGYPNADVSPSNVGFNGLTSPISFSSATPFLLQSGYFTSAFLDAQLLTVIGTGGAIPQTTSFLISPNAPTFVTFNWTGLTDVSFTPSGGLPRADFSLNGNHYFAVDNLTVSAVPEPSTLALLGLGLGFVGLVVSRRLKSRAPSLEH